MSDMTYCQMRNTSSDLRDAVEYLSDHEVDELSEDERKSFIRIVKLAVNIAQDYGYLIGVDVEVEKTHD